MSAVEVSGAATGCACLRFDLYADFTRSLLTHMLETGDMADVEVTVADEWTIKSHKAVLTRVSGYFRTMFEDRPGSGGPCHPLPQVSIPECISVCTFRQILQFTYCGSTGVDMESAADSEATGESLIELLRAATRLQMPALAFACLKAIIDHLNVANCLIVWLCVVALIPMFGPGQLRQHQYSSAVAMMDRCRLFVGRHFSQLITRNEFFELEAEHVRLFLSIDELATRTEEDACRAALNWLHYRPRARQGDVITILGSIRLEYLDFNYIRHKLLDDEVVRFSPERTRIVLLSMIQQRSGDTAVAGLRSFPRLSTGVERVLLIAGCVTGDSERPEMELNVTAISLQRPNHRPRVVTRLPSIPTCESAAFAFNDSFYVVGIGRHADEIWRYSLLNATKNGEPPGTGATTSQQDVGDESGMELTTGPPTPSPDWSLYGRLETGRRRHCVATVGRLLCVVGGNSAVDDSLILDSIEVFDLSSVIFDRGSRRPTALLATAVESASCVVYRRFVYVIGGTDAQNVDVTDVQCYDVDECTCTVVTRLPAPARLMRAMLYRNFVICLGKTRAFVLDLEQMRWARRSKFATGRNFYGWAVENGTVFTVGGRVDARQPAVYSAEIRSLSVECIVRGTAPPCECDCATEDVATWRVVGQLPEPLCVFAHCVVLLPTGVEYPTGSSACETGAAVAAAMASRKD